MKAIICGGGQVGYNIAKYLCLENFDVTLIDQRPEVVGRASNTLDIRGVIGHSAHPQTLKDAGAEDADLIIAATKDDEVNMVVCQVAHSLFNIQTKIARIRQQDYLDPAWSGLFKSSHMPIDVVISPEQEIAATISKRLQMSGAFEYFELGNHCACVIGIKCDENCPIIHTPLNQLWNLFPELKIKIFGIVRNGKFFIPNRHEHLLEGDQVFCITQKDHLDRVLSAFGQERYPIRNVVIVGGGNIGSALATRLSEGDINAHVKIIELSPDRAHQLAQDHQDIVVLNGNILDQEIISEAEFPETDVIITVTNDDEVNILSCLIAKKYGCHHSFALINNDTYSTVSGTFDIDSIVSPKSVTASTIVQHIRRGQVSKAYSLHNEYGEIIETLVTDTNYFCGQKIADLHLKNGILIAGIIRSEEFIPVDAQSIILENDQLILFSTPQNIHILENLLMQRSQFL